MMDIQNDGKSFKDDFTDEKFKKRHQNYRNHKGKTFVGLDFRFEGLTDKIKEVEALSYEVICRLEKFQK